MPDDLVLLAGPDTDYGLCPLADAVDTARRLADAEGVAITVRCPVTDNVLATYTPGEPGAPAELVQADPVIEGVHY